MGVAAKFEEYSRFTSSLGSVDINARAADILVEDLAGIASSFDSGHGDIDIRAQNLVMAGLLTGEGDIAIELQGNYAAADPSLLDSDDNHGGAEGNLAAGGNLTIRALSGSVDLGRISDYEIQGAFAIESQSVEMIGDLSISGGGLSIKTTGADGISIGSIKSALGNIVLDAVGGGIVAGRVEAEGGALDIDAGTNIALDLAKADGKITIDAALGIDIQGDVASTNDIVQITAKGGDLSLGALEAKGAGSFLKALGTTVDPDHPGLQIEGVVNILDDAGIGGDLMLVSNRGIEIAAAVMASGKITIDAALGIDIQGDVASANDIVQITARGGDLSIEALEAKGAGSFLKALGTTVDPDHPNHPGLWIGGIVNILDDAGIGGDLMLVSNRGIEIAASVTAAGEIHFTSSEDLAFEEAVTSTGGAVTLISTAGNIRSIEGISASNALSLTAEESIRIHSATSTNANVELSVTKTGTLTGIQGLLSVLGDIIADGRVRLDTQGQIIVRGIESSRTSGGGITIGNPLSSFVTVSGKLVAASGDVDVAAHGSIRLQGIEATSGSASVASDKSNIYIDDISVASTVSVMADGRVVVGDVTSTGNSLITLTSTGDSVYHGQLNSTTTPDINQLSISSAITIPQSTATKSPLSSTRKAPTQPSRGQTPSLPNSFSVPTAKGIEEVPDAPDNFRAEVYLSASGIPIVNIVAPNTKGISHNLFTRLDVGREGIVLNNSKLDFERSELAGILTRNTNLDKGREASVIIGEVLSHRSVLLGFTEIHGRNAEYVLINPNGIYCDGCGFINTPRVTFATAESSDLIYYANESLNSITVREGGVQIGRGGTSLGSAEYFDIISRTIQVAGQVSVKGNSESKLESKSLNPGSLGIFLGASRYSYQSGLLEPSLALTSKGTPPPLALELWGKGSLMAGHLLIESSEASSGLRFFGGQLQASSGNVELTADGSIELLLRDDLGVDVYAAGRLRVSSSSGHLRAQKGTLVAERGSVWLRSLGDISLEEVASVHGDGDIWLTSGEGDIQIYGGQAQSSHGALYLSAATDIGISGSFTADAKTGLSFRSASGGIEAQGGSFTVSKGSISLKSYDSIGLLDSVEISSSDYLSIYSQGGGFHMYGGHLDAGKTIDLYSFEEIELRDGVKFASETGDLSIYSKAGGFKMYDGGFLRADAGLSLRVHESIELRGDLNSAASVNIWADKGGIFIESESGGFIQAEGGSLRADGNIYVLAQTSVELWDGVDIWSELGSIGFGKSLTQAGVLMSLDEGFGVYGEGNHSSLSALKGLQAVATGNIELRDGVRISVGKRGSRTSGEGVLLRSERGSILVDDMGDVRDVDDSWIVSESGGTILLSALYGDIKIVGADVASEGGKVGVEAGKVLGVKGARITAKDGITLRACERLSSVVVQSKDYKSQDQAYECNTSSVGTKVEVSDNVKLLSGDDLFIQGYNEANVSGATLRAGVQKDGILNPAKNGFGSNPAASLTVWSNKGDVDIKAANFASAGDLYLDADKQLIRTGFSLRAIRNLTLSVGEYKSGSITEPFRIGSNDYFIAGGELILNLEGANIVNEGLIFSGTEANATQKRMTIFANSLINHREIISGGGLTLANGIDDKGSVDDRTDDSLKLMKRVKNKTPKNVPDPDPAKESIIQAGSQISDVLSIYTETLVNQGASILSIGDLFIKGDLSKGEGVLNEGETYERKAETVDIKGNVKTWKTTLATSNHIKHAAKIMAEGDLIISGAAKIQNLSDDTDNTAIIESGKDMFLFGNSLENNGRGSRISASGAGSKLILAKSYDRTKGFERMNGEIEYDQTMRKYTIKQTNAAQARLKEYGNWKWGITELKEEIEELTSIIQNNPTSCPERIVVPDRESRDGTVYGSGYTYTRNLCRDRYLSRKSQIASKEARITSNKASIANAEQTWRFAASNPKVPSAGQKVTINGLLNHSGTIESAGDLHIYSKHIHNRTKNLAIVDIRGEWFKSRKSAYKPLIVTTLGIYLKGEINTSGHITKRKIPRVQVSTTVKEH